MPPLVRFARGGVTSKLIIPCLNHVDSKNVCLQYMVLPKTDKHYNPHIKDVVILLRAPGKTP